MFCDSQVDSDSEVEEISVRGNHSFRALPRARFELAECACVLLLLCSDGPFAGASINEEDRLRGQSSKALKRSCEHGTSDRI